MDIHEYLDKMKEIQAALLTYLDSNENEEENYHHFIKLYDDHEIHHHPHKVRSVLHLMVNVANNHHRIDHFFDKIEKILHKIRHGIHHYFTNYEIFTLFKSNKRILLYLINEKIMEIDQQIATVMMTDELKATKYPQYFYPEIKQYLNEKENEEISKEIPDEFEEKRKLGENDNLICRFIRTDSVAEFASYSKQQDLSFKSKIEPSIFETNSFLIKNQPTLIEYAAFFNSKGIIKYLKSKDVDLSSSCWIYAIHSQDSDLLHLLKEEHIRPKFKNYEGAVKEAVKCHHNEILNYIQENFLLKEKAQPIDVSKEGIKYYNFFFIEEDFNVASVFHDLCKYDYFTIVQIILKKKDIFNDHKSRKRNIFIHKNQFFFNSISSFVISKSIFKRSC